MGTPGKCPDWGPEVPDGLEFHGHREIHRAAGCSGLHPAGDRSAGSDEQRERRMKVRARQALARYNDSTEPSCRRLFPQRITMAGSGGGR